MGYFPWLGSCRLIRLNPWVWWGRCSPCALEFSRSNPHQQLKVKSWTHPASPPPFDKNQEPPTFSPHHSPTFLTSQPYHLSHLPTSQPSHRSHLSTSLPSHLSHLSTFPPHYSSTFPTFPPHHLPTSPPSHLTTLPPIIKVLQNNNIRPSLSLYIDF